MTLGREALNWSAETWTAIDRGMHEENLRAGVTAKVIPLLGPLPDALAVPAETIDAGTMTVDEERLLPLVELSIEFALTRKQVDLEHELGTAVTLTRRAASLLTQAEDLAVLQGDAALANGQLPSGVRAQGAAGQGLVAAATDAIGGEGGPEGTFRAVAEAYALLQARRARGPMASCSRPSATPQRSSRSRGRRCSWRSGSAGSSRRSSAPRRCRRPAASSSRWAATR